MERRATTAQSGSPHRSCRGLQLCTGRVSRNKLVPLICRTWLKLIILNLGGVDRVQQINSERLQEHERCHDPSDVLCVCSLTVCITCSHKISLSRLCCVLQANKTKASSDTQAYIHLARTHSRSVGPTWMIKNALTQSLCVLSATRSNSMWQKSANTTRFSLQSCYNSEPQKTVSYLKGDILNRFLCTLCIKGSILKHFHWFNMQKTHFSYLLQHLYADWESQNRSF